MTMEGPMRRAFLAMLVLAAVACRTGTDSAAPDEDEEETRPPTPPEWDRVVTRPAEAEASARRQACTFGRGALAGETLGKEVPIEKDIPLETIVVLMQENRSFDHYFSHFGRYAGRTDVASAKDGTTNPVDRTPTIAVRPYQHAPHLCFLDTDHGWRGSHEQYNDGKMDGFVVTNHKYKGEVLPDPNKETTDGGRAMWWYDERDIPFYYALAKSFGIGDHYHASLMGPTWVNRMFLYGGTSFGLTHNTLPSIKGKEFPGYDLTLFDELEKRHVSWGFYASGPPGVALMLGATMGTRWGRRVTKSVAEFHADAAAGRLPQVAFVDTNYLDVGDPEDGETEHPPEDLQRGQKFVYDLVRSLTRSPQWKSLALFITYDEHGGLYDHVVPPPACVPDVSPVTGEPGQVVSGAFDRLGFRVPLLVVSPFAKRGYVSHETYDHTSILRFIQAKHRVPALTARDANARIPTDFFDFSRPPDLAVPAFTEPPIDPVEAEYCRLTFKR